MTINSQSWTLSSPLVIRSIYRYQKYPERIAATQKKTELKDAVRTAYGKMNGREITICCMDFAFIGGSMGSVVGEKIARGINHSLKKKIPFLMISKSGGARMMEAGFSLMQMAKTSARLALLSEAKIPYISPLEFDQCDDRLCHAGDFTLL